jgi:hypothetical protein
MDQIEGVIAWDVPIRLAVYSWFAPGQPAWGDCEVVDAAELVPIPSSSASLASWGSNDDQRVSLRLEDGDETGLLYVYDPTWDEYAVLGTGLRLAVVENAFARSPQLGEHPTVEAFVTLLPKVSAVRPTPGHEL